MKRKLFIVDPQNGFMDNGSLPVAGSQARMEALAEYLKSLDTDYYEKIYVSLDWHPVNHFSFFAQGGPWPEHCVAYTTGALVTEPLLTELLRWLNEDKVEYINKGTDKNVEEYSALDNPATAAHLKAELADTDVLDVCGVVGTICVQNTIKGLIEKAIDAKKINVLPNYVAQFDEKSETEFIAWCKETLK